MNYLEMKKRHQDEVNSFPMMFAFNEDQFDEGLKKLGVSKNPKKEIISIGGGGFIRKTDRNALLALYERHAHERSESMANDDFMIDAIAYELGNHEYVITWDAGEALDTLGVSFNDERVDRLLQIAKKKYLKGFYRWQEEE